MGVTVIELGDLRAPAAVRDANAAREVDRARYVDECYLCGRPMTAEQSAKAWHVHVAAGRIVGASADVAEADDEGWFPVGADCARRVPREYRSKVGH